jgi:hypothetical protein
LRPFEKFYYAGVPGLGNVAVSRHAQDRAAEDGISEEIFQRVLQCGKDRPDGLSTVWREELGIRLVILRRPEPFRGASLVTTVYRVDRSATARKQR